MIGHTATVRCPNCDHLCETTVPEPPPPRAGAYPRDAWEVEELACPCCGWEFAAWPDGRVFDDGEPDRDGPFAVDPDGGPTAEPGAEIRCARCAHLLDVGGEPGPVRCPYCLRREVLVWSDRREMPVPLTRDRCPDWLPDPEADDWSDYDPNDLDEDDDESDIRYCPSGCPIYDDGVEQYALPGGWVMCSGCRATYHDPEIWADWSCGSLAGVGSRQRVIVGPGDRVHDLGKAFATVRADGVVRLRPGTYRWSVQPPPGVTVAVLGPAGSAVIDPGNKDVLVVGGPVRFAGLTFRGPVELRQAVADFRRCTFADAGSLAVLGGRSTAWVRGCRVGGSGVWAHDGAAARLIRTAVVGAGGHGVWATGGGLVTLDRCRVAGSGGDGIRADAPGGVFLRRSVVADNAGAGVRVRDRAVLAGCRVEGSVGPDVVVEAGGRAVVRRCRLASDIVAEPGARVRVRRPRPDSGADRCFIVG